jgi:outer membrane lipoprotein-sorting protein
MRFLRTLPTRRLVLLIVAAIVVAAGATAIAVAAGGKGPTPPAKRLDRAIYDALAAPAPAGITARVKFTNKLFPSGALLGNVGSALMSGASGRLWATNDGRGRIELQANAGDVQVVWNHSAVSIFDASSNTVYRFTLPAAENATPDSTDKRAGPPALAEIDSLLKALGAHATISAAQPTDVAGRPAYNVSLSPKHDGGLLASAALAWDAERGVPLRIAVFAQGGSSPVLELTVTQISYGSVPSSDVDVKPPAGAKVVDIGSPAHESAGARSAPVTGLAAVRAAAGFPVAAPDTLVGLPRRDVRLVGPSDSRAVLVLYGHGLGGIVLVERRSDSKQPGNGFLSSLPTVSLDGVTAHELATQLGTVLEWQRGGTAFVLAGSLPPAAAEAAARQLK